MMFLVPSMDPGGVGSEVITEPHLLLESADALLLEPGDLLLLES